MGTDEYLEQCAFTLAACHIEHLIDGNTLFVRSQDAEAAIHHLQCYWRENANWPPRPQKTAGPPVATALIRPPTLLIFGSLAIFHLVTGPWQAANPWFVAGTVDSRLIFEQDQWWRLVTGLTLHADLNHLLGNLAVGGAITHLLCLHLGYGYGWFLLLIAAVLGNLVNILVRSGFHLAVGFSTAVFAGIGLFCGLQIRSRQPSLSALTLSLGSGLGLLAFLGSEGVDTDLGAHFFGLLSGLLLGSVPGPWFLHHRDLPRLQLLLFVCTMATVLGCWWMAYQEF